MDFIFRVIMDFIFPAIAVILCIIALVIDIKTKKIILEKSQRVKTLLDLNKTIHFKTIPSKYSNHLSCNSKRQLDNLSIDDYLISLIDSNEAFYRNIIETISFNRNSYNAYMTQAQDIPSTATEEYCRSFRCSLTRFLMYEERAFKKYLLPKPQLDIEVYCKATYTSPQGRNHYQIEESYSYDELQELFNDTMELKAERQTRQCQITLERAKMTHSLRYDILTRDNYRCQICGSTAQDGVKLHVDHIIPVSKGGKTEPSNLRTLCDRCNLGKSDKM